MAITIIKIKILINNITQNDPLLCFEEMPTLFLRALAIMLMPKASKLSLPLAESIRLGMA